MTTAYLLINGPGKWSLDAVLQKEEKLVPARYAQAA
jgi:hypothetical protein